MPQAILSTAEHPRPARHVVSIHLDDQSGLEANEIEHVAPEWMLAAKLVANPVGASGMLPTALFRIGLTA